MSERFFIAQKASQGTIFEKSKENWGGETDQINNREMKHLENTYNKHVRHTRPKNKKPWVSFRSKLDAIFSRNLNMLASAVRNPRFGKKEELQERKNKVVSLTEHIQTK
jgi:hypothetical protein